MTGRIFTALVMTLASLCAYPSSYTKDVWHALERGADVDVLFRVVDDEGVPVDGASCSGWLYQEGVKGQGSGYSGTTDTNGCFRVRGKCGEWFSLVVRKKGWYETMLTTNYPCDKTEPMIVDGKWQPYGETRTVVLKKIAHPIPLGKVGRCSIAIPEFDKWIGFDFEKRQWVPPYGSGESADVMLRFGRDIQDRQTNYKVTMDVSFAHLPHAGCYELKSDAFSERNTVYHADTNACFQTTLSYSQVRRPESRRVENWLDKDSYLVFRTRTATDEEGRLKSAHYGIIRGPWSSFNTMLSSGFLFNAVPNDINLEDDHTARLSQLHYQHSLEFEKSRKGK